MRNVEIRIFSIARPQIDASQVREWLDFIGAEDYKVPQGDPGAVITELTGRRCYMSFIPGLNPNVTKIRENPIEYIENILASKHGNLLRHVNYTYAIENVSRILTGELNRHSAGVGISEGSQRYIRFTDIPWWVPHIFRPNPSDSEELANKKIDSILVMQRVFQVEENGYRDLEHIWGLDEPSNSLSFHEKKQLTSAFRRIVGMGVATGGVWTFNLQALRHVLTQRIDPAAEEEIRYLAALLLADISRREVAIFGDFHQNEQGNWQPKYWKV